MVSNRIVISAFNLCNKSVNFTDQLDYTDPSSLQTSYLYMDHRYLWFLATFSGLVAR
jgi:hypothetical protein